MLTITFQPLGLSFFNSITKLLTNLHFESFSTSFYLLFFCYMLYNSKWSKNFQVCSQLALKNESKKHHHFGHSFIQMWVCEVQLPSFLQSQKNDFSKFVCLYLAINMVKISEIFSTSSQTNFLWLHVSKNVLFSKIWYLY